MKKINFLLAIILLIPTITLAGQFGAAIEITECSIGEIETSYSVKKNKVHLEADIYIKNNVMKPVIGASITTGWIKDSKVIDTDKCITGEDGKCMVEHTATLKGGRKAKDLPQIGVRITGVTCPDLKYMYVPNSGFAWIILNN